MNGYVESSRLGHHLEHFRSRVGDDLPVLDLPTDRPRPARQSLAVAQCPVRVPPGLRNLLSGLARTEGTTLGAVVLAGFQALLHRYTGQDDVVVGSPFLRRTCPEHALLVAPLANPLPLRSRAALEAVFRSMVRNAHTEILGAADHQAVPLSVLAREFGWPVDCSYSTGFQALFALDSTSLGSGIDTGTERVGPGAVRSWRPGPLEAHALRLPRRASVYDLSLLLESSDDALVGCFEYATDLFDASTIERMARHFVALLASAAADPDAEMGSLGMLARGEREQLIASWNQTAAPLESGRRRLIHQQVFDQAALTPQALAVQASDGALTYAELAERAAQLSCQLASMGVRPGVAVGVALRRTTELPIALLGVLGAGGAYVPLDPDYPTDRTGFVLADSKAPVIVTEAGLVAGLPPTGAQVLCVDRDRAALAAQPKCRFENQTRPEDLAYFIYTSGSTGRPKGVMIEHRNATAFLAWARSEYSSDDLANVLAGTSITFDLSIFELFATLTAGGCVHLVQNALALVSWPERERLTLINTVPSAMQELVSLGALPRSIRVVNLAGEPLTGTLVQAVHTANPACRIYNLYGPSEDTTYSTYSRIDPSEERPTIGRPLANRRAYVLDPRMEPVPLGVTGEIYLGGAGVARGYLDRDDLTRQSFVADPFSGDGRLYRTGDLARRRADGRLEFLGRKDHQIKLRGYRIELGEIDAVLREHPDVSEALTVAWKERGELVVYVVCGNGADMPALRAHLSARLPKYMVPSAWMRLDAIPRLPNGKVNHKALSRAERAASLDLVVPRSKTEAALAAMWSELLKITAISVTDDFFSLGGHSLLVVRLGARIRASFGVNIPLAELARMSTIEVQARAIDAAERSDLAPIPRRASASEPAPLSFVQERLWLLDQIEPGSTAYNFTAALRITGPLNVSALERSLDTILVRHDVFRTRYSFEGSAAVQYVSPPQRFVLPVYDHSHLPLEEARDGATRLESELAARPFELSEGPFLRALLVRIAPEEHVLAASTHNIAFDDSHEQFIAELGTLYTSFAAGLDPALPPLPVQYPDFALWQRTRMSGERLAAGLAYWRSKLAGPLPVLELPSDRPRPVVRTSRGARTGFELPTALAARIEALARAAGTTLFQTFLAAFWTFLGRVANQDDVLVAVPIHDRSHPDLEPAIGNFINTVVHRGDLSDDPSFQSLLARARAVSLEARQHAEVPFNLVVDALGVGRSTTWNPVAQVMLSVAHRDSPIELGGLHVEPIAAPAPSSRLDLLLGVWRTPSGISGVFEYSTELFDADTVVRLSAHFTTLLEAIAEHPDVPVSRLAVLTKAERTRLIEGWNATETPFGSDLCIHQLFERRVATQPDATAVIAGAETLSYRQLDARAAALAGRLHAAGVGPGTKVGIHLERGIELVAAMLAVLRAGGCYVPLEIGTPPMRLRALLGSLEIATVLVDGATVSTIEGLRASLPALRDLVNVDEHDHAGAPAGTLSAAASPDDLAYVIFTSGSAGTPKGVAVRHRPVINVIEWVNRTYAVGPDDRVLFVTSVGFDLSVYDVFGVLAAGGSVRIASAEEVRDPGALARILESEPITFWDSAPALLAQCMPYFEKRDATTRALRLVFLSGDWIPTSLPDEVRASFPRARVVGLGGATEAVIWSNHFPIDRVDPGWTSIPYGRPIQNARYHVLDRYLEPCPIGVAGDLYIGGEVLADGYVGDRTLTDSKFIPDPFRRTPGARLYRTGDRARYWADGNLEFLGRKDQQVKVRGFRVELGEVEAVLAQHPSVREATVLAHGDRHAQWLGAYIVSRDATPEASALRVHLRERVPEQMVPSAFVFVDVIPLTPSGKIDRRALAARAKEPSRNVEITVLPSNETENAIAATWKQVLGLQEVGIHDNFFDLGGNSVLLAQVHRRLQVAFARRLPMVDLFQFSTIHRLAARLLSGETPDNAPVSRAQVVAAGTHRLRSQLARKRRPT